MSRYHVNHTTKIAQLADQAHEESNTVYNKRLETERADSVIFFDIFNQKFAELIVRECYEHCKGQVLDKEVADTNELTYNDAVGDCANGLLQHFGVAE